MERRLATILAADVVGYSKLMATDKADTLTALRPHRECLFDPEMEKRGGRIVKLMGDGTLVEFPSLVDAVEAAIAIQKTSRRQRWAARFDRDVTDLLGVQDDVTRKFSSRFTRSWGRVPITIVGNGAPRT